jgi:hypothetical protein
MNGISEREKAFKISYEKFIKKWNVIPVIYKSSDEWGDFTHLVFMENGKYCNINCSVDCKVVDEGYHGMGS